MSREPRRRRAAWGRSTCSNPSTAQASGGSSASAPPRGTRRHCCRRARRAAGAVSDRHARPPAPLSGSGRDPWRARSRRPRKAPRHAPECRPTSSPRVRAYPPARIRPAREPAQQPWLAADVVALRTAGDGAGAVPSRSDREADHRAGAEHPPVCLAGAKGVTRAKTRRELNSGYLRGAAFRGAEVAAQAVHDPHEASRTVAFSPR
jgi:hypothetical protein